MDHYNIKIGFQCKQSLWLTGKPSHLQKYENIGMEDCDTVRIGQAMIGKV